MATKWLEPVAWGYLAVVLGIWGMISLVSEDWWLGTTLLFIPRAFLVIPAVAISIVAGKLRRRAIWPNVVSMALVLGPIMNFQVHAATFFPPTLATDDLTIVSCNVQSYRPDFSVMLREMNRYNPQIVCLQESYDNNPLADKYFADWNIVDLDEYYIASKFPLKHLGTFHCTAFDRVSAVKVEVTTPQGVFHLVNVHQTSPRPSLTGLRPWAPVYGEGLGELEAFRMQRELEASQTRDFVAEGSADVPVMVVGDFNMTTENSLYQTYWGDLVNAFETVGFGYGFSSPCQEGPLGWPAGWPWLRIDHVLVDPQWSVLRCEIGRENGSDHRLIMARVRQPAVNK